MRVQTTHTHTHPKSDRPTDRDDDGHKLGHHTLNTGLLGGRGGREEVLGKTRVRIPPIRSRVPATLFAPNT